MTKGDLAKKLWTDLVNGFGQGGRTKVEVPADDVMEVLMSVAANVLLGVTDAAERDRLIRGMAPMVDRMVTSARARHSSIHVSSRSPLILPN